MTRETIQVLLVEDNRQDVAIVERMLETYGRAQFEVASVASIKECEEALNEKRFDLILLDYMLPDEDGLSFLRRRHDIVDLPPVIMLTGHGDERVAVQALQCGAYDYFPKHFITSEVLGLAIHQALEKFRIADQLKGAEQALFSLATAVEAKDPTTEGHVRRMVHYTLRLGQALRLNEEDLMLLRCGAVMHDIGKVGVSELILRKPGPLTVAEWEEVRLHPIIGEGICAPLRHSHEVGPIARHHHEHWDGKGYPDELAGDKIPFLARVVAVVDAFDAMCSDRPYHKALPPPEAVRRLSDGAGRQWDPNVTRVFVELVQRWGLAARD